MFYNKIKLADVNNGIHSEATLEIMVPAFYDDDVSSHRLLDCVLVVPGGAYWFCSDREADIVAHTFITLGYAAAIIRYTCGNENDNKPLYPQPQLEVLAALKYLNNNSNELRLNKEKINVVGFSAGGNLAGTIGYLYKDKDLLSKISATKEEVKPNSLCLCYPVVTMGEYTHGTTCKIITNNDEKLKELLSIEKHIDKDYPQTFVWTTETDQAVPCANTKMLIDALNKANVRHYGKLYPNGLHGLSIGSPVINHEDNYFPEVEEWVKNYDKFLK